MASPGQLMKFSGIFFVLAFVIIMWWLVSSRDSATLLYVGIAIYVMSAQMMVMMLLKRMKTRKEDGSAD